MGWPRSRQHRRSHRSKPHTPRCSAGAFLLVRMVRQFLPGRAPCRPQPLRDYDNHMGSCLCTFYRDSRARRHRLVLTVAHHARRTPHAYTVRAATRGFTAAAPLHKRAPLVACAASAKANTPPCVTRRRILQRRQLGSVILAPFGVDRRVRLLSRDVPPLTGLNDLTGGHTATRCCSSSRRRTGQAGVTTWATRWAARRAPDRLARIRRSREFLLLATRTRGRAGRRRGLEYLPWCIADAWKGGVNGQT